MKNMLIVFGLFLASFSSISSFAIRLTVNSENEKQVSSLSVTQRQNTLMKVLKEDFNNSDKKVEKCGFPEVVQCFGKIAEAAATCIQYPDVSQCIKEFIDAELGCEDCIEAICKALYIPGC